VPFSTTSVESAIVCSPPHGETDLDHGQHSAFFKFANNYWCRAGDPCEGKSLGRHAVCSPCHTGSSDAAHSTLELISLTPSPAGSGRWVVDSWLLLAAALAGCATGPSPEWLNARAGCRQQWKATSNPRPTTVSDAYIDQCMAVRGYLPR
jgi:hypothetical protein